MRHIIPMTRRSFVWGSTAVAGTSLLGCEFKIAGVGPPGAIVGAPVTGPYVQLALSWSPPAQGAATWLVELAEFQTLRKGLGLGAARQVVAYSHDPKNPTTLTPDTTAGFDQAVFSGRVDPGHVFQIFIQKPPVGTWIVWCAAWKSDAAYGQHPPNYGNAWQEIQVQAGKNTDVFFTITPDGKIAPTS